MQNYLSMLNQKKKKRTKNGCLSHVTGRESKIGGRGRIVETGKKERKKAVQVARKHIHSLFIHFTFY